MDKTKADTIRTRIWKEVRQEGDRFAARTAYCHGYDVFGEMMGNARWVEMLYLLFRGDRPSASDADLLEALAVALANPGPRDPSVHAAMCAGICGSPMASALMAALASGAGQLGGAREVFLLMQDWEHCGTSLSKWKKAVAARHGDPASIWPALEHPSGFDPNGVRTPGVVVRCLQVLAAMSGGACLAWLERNRETLESAAGCPLSMTAVAAATYRDLGFAPDQAETIHLLLRLPGAAAHALEQTDKGYRNFPFYPVELQDDAMARSA
jgi:citrate synthase